MELVPGTIVIYKLRRADCDRILCRRGQALGGFGSRVQEGDQVPAIVVKAWSPTNFNGQAFLDGYDSLWLTSVAEGDQPGQWRRTLQWMVDREEAAEASAKAN